MGGLNKKYRQLSTRYNICRKAALRKEKDIREEKEERGKQIKQEVERRREQNELIDILIALHVGGDKVKMTYEWNLCYRGSLGFEEYTSSVKIYQSATNHKTALYLIRRKLSKGIIVDGFHEEGFDDFGIVFNFPQIWQREDREKVKEMLKETEPSIHDMDRGSGFLASTSSRCWCEL